MSLVPLSGNGEESPDQLPPVWLGVHVHAEIHGSLWTNTHTVRLIHCTTVYLVPHSLWIIAFVAKLKLLSMEYILLVRWRCVFSPCLVYEVSVDTVGKLLDEGVHDELQVGPGTCFLILLFFTQKQGGHSQTWIQQSHAPNISLANLRVTQRQKQQSHSIGIDLRMGLIHVEY